MKKVKKERRISFKWVLIVAAVLVLILAAVILVPIFLRARNRNKMVQQQNYVSSKLMEMGNYEESRILAAESEQLQPNAISRELLVLAMGFQGDYETGAEYAVDYLDQGEDSVIEEAYGLYQDFLASESEWQKEEQETYEEYVSAEKSTIQDSLLVLLLQVQNSINVKIDSETLTSLIAALTEDAYVVSESDIEVLKEDGSSIAKKALLSYAVDMGDYESAYETAEDLYDSTHSFESRATLANVAAEYGTYLYEGDSAITQLQQKEEDAYEQLYAVYDQYWQSTTDEEIADYEEQIAEMEEALAEIESQIQAETVKRSINFIEITTPVSERKAVSYKVELSQLYYKAGDSEKARELLVDAIKTESDSSDDMVSDMLAEMSEQYQESSSGSSELQYVDEGVRDLETMWNRIAEVLGILNSYSEWDEDSYYDFILRVMDEIYNGVIIRSIDATDFPTVRVTVNISMELEETLVKSNFTLEDMGESVDFTLLSTDELDNEAGDVSISLVIDRSGSMIGTPIEDTKKAITNFIKGADSDIRIGITEFDSTASVTAPVGSSRNTLLRTVSEIVSDGGTSIYSGLQAAGEDLASESGRKVIILLSDGEDGDAYMIEDVLAYLKSQNIYVYTIGFGSADSDYLSYIATSCGGKYIAAESSEVLNEIYAAVGQYIVNDYVLEFEAVTDIEDFSRDLSVAVDVNNAYDEEDYDVGVSLEDIENEVENTPISDYFQQIGGSAGSSSSDEDEIDVTEDETEEMENSETEDDMSEMETEEEMQDSETEDDIAETEAGDDTSETEDGISEMETETENTQDSETEDDISETEEMLDTGTEESVQDEETEVTDGGSWHSVLATESTYVNEP